MRSVYCTCIDGECGDAVWDIAQKCSCKQNDFVMYSDKDIYEAYNNQAWGECNDDDCFVCHDESWMED